jgi:hypothetical protein
MGQRYQHYKGGIYEVRGEALLESDRKTVLVIYTAPDGQWMARDRQEFHQLIEVNGQRVKRFTLIDGSNEECAEKGPVLMNKIPLKAIVDLQLLGCLFVMFWAFGGAILVGHGNMKLATLAWQVGTMVGLLALSQAMIHFYGHTLFQAANPSRSYQTKTQQQSAIHDARKDCKTCNGHNK